MRPIPRIADALDGFAIKIGKIAAWASVLMMMVIVFDVISRRFFVLGSTQLQELEWHLHAVVFLLALAYTYACDGHVRIELVRDNLSERAKLWVELLGTLFLLLPFIGIGFYFSLVFVYDSFVQGEGSNTVSGLPYRWIIKSAMPIGFGLLLLTGIGRLCTCIDQLSHMPAEQAGRGGSSGEGD